MKRTKGFFIFVFAACGLFLLPSFAAKADAPAPVPKSSFYERHKSDCVAVDRYFYPNGPDGYVSAKKEPGSTVEIERVKNERKIAVLYVYNYKGEIWGLANLSGGYSGYGEYDDADGWIPMDQLLVVYDYISFAEEHQDEFYPYRGSFDFKAAGSVLGWAWPGTDRAPRSVSLAEIRIYGGGRFVHAYTNEQGREWGFIKGSLNIWVCISDYSPTAPPEAEDAEGLWTLPPMEGELPSLAHPVNTEPPPTVWHPAEPISPKTGDDWPAVVFVMIALMIVLAIFLIRISLKPKQK